MNDLGRQLTEALKQVQAAAPATQAAAPQTNQLTQDDIIKMREILGKAAAPGAAAPQAAAPQAAAPNYTPVFMGYAYPQAAPAAAVPQAAAPQQPAATGTSMQLVPVQLYRQKSFLGWDKLKPVNAYPYGVR